MHKVYSEDLYKKYVYSGGLKNVRKIKNKIAFDLQTNCRNALHKQDNLSVLFTQKLVMHCLRSRVYQKLSIMTISGKKKGLAIPKNWFGYFEEQYKISRFNSKIQFKFFVLIKIFKSFVKSLFYLMPNFNLIYNREFDLYRAKGSNLVLLNSNMININLFDVGDDELSCFTNWYKDYFQQKNTVFLHSVKSLKKSNSKHLFYFKKFPIKFINYPKFLRQASLVYLFALKEWIFGDYRKIYCIADLVEDLRFKTSSAIFLPDVVIFNESNGIVRPLYSYSLEARGCKIQFIPVSTSDSANLSGEEPDFFPWQLSSWPEYFVYDEYQFNFLKKAIGDPKVTINKIYQIPFNLDANNEINPKRNRYVALFDITPHPFNYGSTSLNDIGSNFNDEWEKFLLNCLTTAKELGITIHYKPKRSINSKHNGKFIINFLKNLSANEHFNILNPNLSPHRIIRGSIGVVSTPITTPAFIAQQLNKPSAFYSESNLLSTSDPVFRSIPILQNTVELREWFSKLV
jgi:polysaccharide biosynthesis PFTS motif protein